MSGIRGDANCLITIADFGKVRVKATRVTHGLSIISYSPEGQSRAGAAFYPAKEVSADFTVTVVFTTFGGYRRVCEWLERYSRWAANPRTKATPVRVIIPTRNFDKVGVLRSGVTYGDKVGAVSYRIDLTFVGSRDPLELVGKNISQFRLPRDAALHDPSLPYLYPGGNQLEGGENGWDTVWDQAPGDDPTGPVDIPEPLPTHPLPPDF